MPKLPMDYSNTVFYKIYCRDSSVNDLYIGHTTNFVQRKHAHKQACNNVKNTSYKCKLYQVMRENSGWDNWKMDIIAFHECDNLLAAKIQEQKYYEEYKATLNSIEPLPKPKPKIVKDVVKKETSIFYCNKYKCVHCDYYTNNIKDYNKHLRTRKHTNRTSLTNIEHESPQCQFKCECGKEYPARNSLWYHKKKCDGIEKNKEVNHELNEENIIGVETDKELLIKILLKNQEIMEKLMEIIPNIGNNSHDLSSK